MAPPVLRFGHHPARRPLEEVDGISFFSRATNGALSLISTFLNDANDPMSLSITCHCGAAAQRLTPCPTTTQGLVLCHCATCRHATGELCASYYPVAAPASLAGLTAFATGSETRHFCSTCGCHVFLSRRGPGAESEWGVATGTITSEPDPGLPFARHAGVASTGDGGLAAWLPPMPVDDGDEEAVASSLDGSDNGNSRGRGRGDVLPASCACGRVRFHVTRPNDASTTLQSPYADLLMPYHTSPREVVSNPRDEKWWLRSSGRYLAGTCACRSCRLISGFEVQAWAFVPRVNIVFRLPAVLPGEAGEGGAVERGGGSHGSRAAGEEQDAEQLMPLDFARLPAGILRAYVSTPGVVREFCGQCGATVFWHDGFRPDLIDVSAGLFHVASGGVRAEAWLDWWTGRVSFAEERRRGRDGATADRAAKLIEDLERGLHAWTSSEGQGGIPEGQGGGIIHV